jgi:hypothetical protein
MNSLVKKRLEEFSPDVTLVSTKFAEKIFGKDIDYIRDPIVYITFCERKIQQFTLFVTDYMKLEAKKPAHRTFPSLDQVSEYFIGVYKLVMTYFNRSAIHICNACAFTKSKQFGEMYNHPGVQLNKTVVGNSSWKITLHVLTNI